MCAIVYAVGLLLVAFWPMPVDASAAKLLGWVTEHFPGLTYRRVEFAANILMFLPFGVLLALLMSGARYLVVPLGLLTSGGIEAGQAVFLSARSATYSDILANIAGTSVGLVLVVAGE
ncbi:VanZ family protein [Microbacterium sp. AK031]|uniref:VanZ family protein n=1 Tax=Microbacterium sp. AK031 TaxID=2723076 RepID=UPI00216711A5|nr:VanZ family protein [Microbacterium sp. AK031]MCS3841737.1 glycopeptide antibiotics resistance protein [Microbacterium sp. AK031]